VEPPFKHTDSPNGNISENNIEAIEAHLPLPSMLESLLDGCLLDEIGWFEETKKGYRSD